MGPIADGVIDLKSSSQAKYTVRIDIAMMFPVLTAFMALTLVLASPTALANEAAVAAEQKAAQVTLNICPELSVRCVAEGDWRNPIGYLGKRRMFQPISPRLHQLIDSVLPRRN